VGSRQINIAIIEPSHIVYEGLANILLRSKYHFRIFRLESAEEYEFAALKNGFDVVILNPQLIQNLTKYFNQLRRLNEKTLWVALLYSFFDKELLTLFNASIRINDEPDDVAETLHRLSLQNDSLPEPVAGEHITERETDVLRLLVNGHSNKEIADKLSISIHTVISHRKNIIQKTGIRSQAGLTIYALSNKIISLDHLGE
jgi:DNA-binding NarL/FixJ family response regulator